MAKQIFRFSPVAWQHINFIGKYEFYNRADMPNIQEVIKNIIAGFENDISAVGLVQKGLQRSAATNRSFGE